MSSFKNNGASGTPFRRGDDLEWFSHYTSTLWQQNAPVIGNSSCSESYWIGGPRRESYVPAGFASNTGSWPSTAIPDPSLLVYGGGIWLGDQRHDEAPFGSLSGAPGGNADGSGTILTGMEVAAPMLEQAFPAVPRVLPEFQHCELPPNWAPVPPPPWQSTSSWDHPVHTARQHSDQSSSIGSLAMRPEIPPFQLATSSVVTGRSERRTMPTGHLPSSTTTPNSVQTLTLRDPVSVASSTSRSRGERWDPSNTSSFQCLWTNRGMRCAALIGGNRRSVTNHFRDEHNFACDGQMIECAWGECKAYMQRRNIPRHIVACHFEIKVTCPLCGLALSRADANKKHRLACTGVRNIGGGDE